MKSAADHQPGDDERAAGLPDLTGVPVDGLLALAGREAPLADAIRRHLGADHDRFAAFGSAVSGEPE